MNDAQLLLDTIMGAIENGEQITLIYNGGHFPGTPRILIPRKVAGHLLYARDPEAHRVKSYRLDQLEIPAAGVEYNPLRIENKKARFSKVDPIADFASWHYPILSYFWPAFGVALRPYVDQARTADARAKALASGAPEATIKRISITSLEYSKPPEYWTDFHEGDTFYSRERDHALQVVACDEYLEVHRIALKESSLKVDAFHISELDLLDWLRSGSIPTFCRIGPGHSYSDILRHRIPEYMGRTL